MEIKLLVDNYSKEGFLCEHGLSMLINDNLLFDTGQSDAFLTNARNLGIDLSKVTDLVISHGHYDHGGGIGYFLEENKEAKVYLHERAFGEYYSKREDSFVYIGLDKDFEKDERIRKIDKFYQLSDKTFLFSKPNMIDPLASTNKGLFMGDNGDLINDRFDHEINLCLKEAGRHYLFLGCGHRGIKNIMEEARTIIGEYPYAVVGGAHLYSKGKESIARDELDKLSTYLLSTKANFYTGHCTGYENYLLLKETMGDRIEYIKAGEKIRI